MIGPPAPEDEDNIMAALKLSDRVISMSLTATSPLLAKLSAIQEPFSELEKLVLLSQENVADPSWYFSVGPSPFHSSVNQDRLSVVTPAPITLP